MHDGRFSTVKIVLKKGDSKGQSWTLTNVDRTGRIKYFYIPLKKSISLTLGPPLIVQPDIRFLPDRKISVDFAILGQAGEVYTQPPKKNGIPSPVLTKITFHDPSGRTLAVGSTRPTIFQLPPKYKERVRIEFSVTVGPFEVIVPKPKWFTYPQTTQPAANQLAKIN